MEIKKYEKQNLIKKIESQISQIKTSYDLVRISEPDIADESNKNILADMIMNLNKFSNVSRKMDSLQVAETVNMLLNEYPRLSLQEYQVFFNRIKSGQFGQLYDSMDGIKIMAFIKEFYDEMVNAYHEFKEENHQQIKRYEKHRDL